MEGPGRKPSKKLDGYIRKEASAITNISPRTIQYYTDRGFVIPEVDPATGRGKTRRYSRKNLVELYFIKELSAHGYTLEKIERIMKKVSKDLDEFWDKSNDIPTATDLFLQLKEPRTRDVEVKLLRMKDIHLDELITSYGFRNFSVIGLEGIILSILKAANGT